MITYSRRGSVWFYEHRRCGRESTSTSRSGRPQSSPTGRKPWGSTLSDLWQYFDKIPLGWKYLKYCLEYLLWFTVGNFEVEGESGDKHVRFQSHLESRQELWQKSFLKVHLKKSWRFEHWWHPLTSWTLGGGRAMARPMKPMIGVEDFWNQNWIHFGISS